jgi:hypothetical protein
MIARKMPGKIGGKILNITTDGRIMLTTLIMIPDNASKI